MPMRVDTSRRACKPRASASPPPPPALRLGHVAASLALSLSLLSSPVLGAPALDTAVTGGERAYRPLSKQESNAKRGLFTADSFQAALEVADYARDVETVARPLETAPGCGRCQPNRLRLERAWQTTAHEALYLDQQKWAQQLKRTLVEAGGVIRDEAQLQASLASLLSAVGDEYSAYLPPPAWERALRRPTGPAQQKYDAALATGVGLQLEKEGGGGWRVAAPGADGPAEAAGVRRGDTLLAVDGVSVTGRSEEEVEASLRGPEGSTVTLLLQPRRGSAAQPRSLACSRGSSGRCCVEDGAGLRKKDWGWARGALSRVAGQQVQTAMTDAYHPQELSFELLQRHGAAGVSPPRRRHQGQVGRAASRAAARGQLGARDGRTPEVGEKNLH